MNQICTACTARQRSPSQATNTLQHSKAAPLTYMCAVQSLGALTGSHDAVCWYMLECLKPALLIPYQWSVGLNECRCDTIGKHHAVQSPGFSPVCITLIAV